MNTTTLSIIKADIGSIGGHVAPSKALMHTVDRTIADAQGDLISDYFLGATGDDILFEYCQKVGKPSSPSAPPAPPAPASPPVTPPTPAPTPETPPPETPPITPPTETPPIESPPVEAPPLEAPPTEAPPPIETPPIELPPIQAPPAGMPPPPKAAGLVESLGIEVKATPLSARGMLEFRASREFSSNVSEIIPGGRSAPIRRVLETELVGDFLLPR